MIGTKIAKDAVIYGVSALEYYGYYNQVRNDVFVITKTKFRTLNYKKVFYKRAHSNIESGINKINSFLSLTDLERSLVDSIKDLEKLVSLEELNNIISSLDENKLKKYLNLHDIQFLYQKPVIY